MRLADAGEEVRRRLGNLGRGWAVLVTTEELARRGAAPEIVRIAARALPREVLIVALPVAEIVRAYPTLGPSGELAPVAAELRSVPPSGARALVVALGRAVLVAWAWPDGSMRLLGLGRT
jgi:hypothetical protein